MKEFTFLVVSENILVILAHFSLFLTLSIQSQNPMKFPSKFLCKPSIPLHLLPFHLYSNLLTGLLYSNMRLPNSVHVSPSSFLNSPLIYYATSLLRMRCDFLFFLTHQVETSLLGFPALNSSSNICHILVTAALILHKYIRVQGKRRF